MRNSATASQAHEALGDCFEVAAELLLGSGAALADISDCVLAHGVVTGQGPLNGMRFSHGWIEGYCNGYSVVIDFSNGNRFVGPRELYYLLGRVNTSEVVRYGPDAARQQLLEHATYGPWEGAALAIGL